LPDGKLRNAVNVVFTDNGNVIFNRPGYTIKKSGSIKWVYKGKFVTLFLDGSDLKKLNDDNTVTTVQSGFGDAMPGACEVSDVIYVSNGITQGKISSDGNYSPWGTQRPTRQPDVSAIESGDMFGGDYKVAITWIGSDESGTGAGKRITVPEGGGIHLTNFPPPPNTVIKIGVYVSSVNGGELYLYGEYPASVNDIFISKSIHTIPLATQFGFVPAPLDIIESHYGRIYYARGNRVYWTAARRYGLQFANSYLKFDIAVTVIVSMPNVLYIGTEKRLYRIINIDGEGAPIREALIDTGAVKGSVFYDDNGNSAYFMSHRGVIMATREGLSELTYNDVAIPFFRRGTTTITETDGLKYLVFVGQGGTQNPLADAEYNSGELARGSL